MKRVLLLIIVAIFFCSGCSNDLFDNSRADEKESYIATLESQNTELKAELAEKELEIDRLKDKVSNSISYANYIVALPDEGKLLVREQPSTESIPIGALYNNDLVKVIEDVDETWVKIMFDKTVGYVMKDYIESLADDYS